MSKQPREWYINFGNPSWENWKPTTFLKRYDAEKGITHFDYFLRNDEYVLVDDLHSIFTFAIMFFIKFDYEDEYMETWLDGIEYNHEKFMLEVLSRNYSPTFTDILDKNGKTLIKQSDSIRWNDMKTLKFNSHAEAEAHVWDFVRNVIGLNICKPDDE